MGLLERDAGPAGERLELPAEQLGAEPDRAVVGCPDDRRDLVRVVVAGEQGFGLAPGGIGGAIGLPKLAPGAGGRFPEPGVGVSLCPAALGAALGKALGLTVTTLLLLVGLAGTAMARPLPDGGAATGCAPPAPGNDPGFGSLRLIVAIAATVIVVSGLAALIAAARRHIHHRPVSTT